jgi:hypothetical protein
VPGSVVQTGLKSNPNPNCSKHFQTISNFDLLEKYFRLLGKIEINMVSKLLKRGTTFSIEISSDSKWIWN